MPADQPEGPRRSPLDDLRERLARLPAGHPSAPRDRPPAGPESPGQGGEPPGPGEPPPIPSTRRSERPGLLEQAARLERLSRVLWTGARAGNPGQQGSGAADATEGTSPLTGPERRGAYQPWFADADRPWFSPDRGGRSG